MSPQFKIEKTLEWREHLQKYLHLPILKSISGTRTQDSVNQRPSMLRHKERQLL
jgi:hypothetical protein